MIRGSADSLERTRHQLDRLGIIVINDNKSFSVQSVKMMDWLQIFPSLLKKFRQWREILG